MLRSLWIGLQFIVGGIAGFFAVGFFWDGGSASSNRVLTDSEIERQFSELPDNAGATYFAVKEFFPEDAARWRDEIRRILKTAHRNVEAAELQIYNAGADIRKRHAQSLRYASGPDLNRVIAQQADLVRPFRSEAAVCNALLMQGPMALSHEQRQRYGTNLGEARILDRAMHTAQRDPVKRPEPTSEDWTALFDLYLSKGFTAEDIDLVVSPDQGDPRLCNAMLGFFDVLRGANFAGSDAIKAELAVAIVNS